MSRRFVLPLCTIIVLTGATAGSLFLSSSPISLDDGLRHITMARVMRSEGIDQTWSRFFYGGYFADHPVDPWFLADVSYIPFTVFSDAVGLRVYSIVGFFALLLALWRVIASLKLSPWWLCTLLMVAVVPSEFTFRILIGRPFVWSTVFALLILDAVIRRRHCALGAILCIATLFSHLFIFPLSFAGVGVVWHLCERRYRPAFFLCMSAFLGTALGLALHPHARAYISYLLNVFLQIPFASPSLRSSEMIPLYSSMLPFVILIVCGLFSLISIKTKSLRLRDVREQGTFLVLALILPLLGAYLVWSRSIDFLWPLLVVLLAHTLVLTKDFSTDLLAVSMKPLLPGVRGGLLIAVVIALASIMTILRIGVLLQRTDAARSMDSLAVLRTIPDGSRMLNPDWSLVPPIIAANPRLKFVAGFDNVFSRIDNPKGFDLLDVYFSIGAQIEHPVIDIRSWITQLLAMYPSDYLVVSEKWAGRLLPALRSTQGLTELTESGALIEVFAIDADAFTDIP